MLQTSFTSIRICHNMYKVLLLILLFQKNSTANPDRCQVKKRECYDPASRFYYDPMQNKCVRYLLRECADNLNSFHSRSLCKQQCVKILKPTTSTTPNGNETQLPNTTSGIYLSFFDLILIIILSAVVCGVFVGLIYLL
uniref:BPTI/Kunitz inhibitor domain-containing protein n=1 Tax=Trichobilharzia regenti TaxID=157069 RepID=A0AA85JB64_TRIRE|nr:unnamed protein product [Trichobilharzia regenti]